MKLQTVLSIAGSDSSGGAGIQADLKTMIANGVYGMSAITSLTAQNTTGVSAIMDVTPGFLEQELDSIFTDIYPDAVKIGMVSDASLIMVISEKLTEYHAKNVVLDPVMVATSGARLLKQEAVSCLTDKLIPIADVLTPNIPEAEILCDLTICSEEDMVLAAKTIGNKYKCNVLLKGGHKINDANDYLYNHETDKGLWFYGSRIDNPNTHGTGCTLSSAIASNLAKGLCLEEAVRNAKDYLSCTLLSGLDLGKGSGPVDHGFLFRQH